MNKYETIANEVVKKIGGTENREYSDMSFINDIWISFPSFFY